VVVDLEPGRGIGRAAVRALRERLIAEPGGPNVALSSEPDNTVAHALYRDLGFRRPARPRAPS
jgi:diamine N-acetyltransferase